MTRHQFLLIYELLLARDWRRRLFSDMWLNRGDVIYAKRNDGNGLRIGTEYNRRRSKEVFLPFQKKTSLGRAAYLSGTPTHPIPVEETPHPSFSSTPWTHNTAGDDQGKKKFVSIICIVQYSYNWLVESPWGEGEHSAQDKEKKEWPQTSLVRWSQFMYGFYIFWQSCFD